MGTQKEQWKFDPGSRDDMGLHCAHTSDERKHACVNACTGMSDPAGEIARLRADAARYRKLREVVQTDGVFAIGEAYLKLKVVGQFPEDADWDKAIDTALSAKEAE